MTSLFPPPHVQPEHVRAHLRSDGYAVLDPRGLATLMGCAGEATPLDSLHPFWNDLPRDEHLRDGGRYRHRRHGSFVVEGGGLARVPHRAHWQSVDYNALHGGIERWFEPLQAGLVAEPALKHLLLALTEQAASLKGSAGPWFVEAHAVRITTAEGIGRPTPEGAHRDGVDLVAVILLERRGIKGGETRVFEAGGPSGQRFTMRAPGTTLLLDDERTIHETTPIQPDSPEGRGWRDTLVLTWRLGSFQAPNAEDLPATQGTNSRPDPS